MRSDRSMDEVVIRNQCALERIDPCFLPLVETVRDGVVVCCGERIREVRLQGSIPRGDAEAGLADLDMIALLDGVCLVEENRCLSELAARLGSESKLVSRFDLEAIDGTRLEPFRRFVLTSDSVCIFGTDTLMLPVQSMERSGLARLVTPDPTTMVPGYLEWVEELADADDAERRFASRIIGKDLLKLLRAVLLLRGSPYEVAIPGIASQVPLAAPEAVGVATLLFALYKAPTNRIETIRRAATSAATFLQSCPESALLARQGDSEPDMPSRAAS